MFRSFLLVITLLAKFQAWADPERIVWSKPHWPPYYIAEGPNTGKGHLDQLLNFIAKQNPDLSFDSIHSEIGQLDFRGKVLEKTCNGAVLRTKEREQSAYFSAFYLQPPVQIIMRTKDWKRSYYEAKVISFKQLLASSAHGVFSSGRSYGDSLNVLLKANIKNDNVSFFARSESLSLLSLVSLGRADYTLEYPEVIRYIQDEKLLNEPLTAIEVEEQRAPYVVYIACPKNAWGKKTLTLLDKAVQKAAATQEFKKLMEEWYPPYIKARFRQEFDEFYKKRAAGEWTTVQKNKN